MFIRSNVHMHNNRSSTNVRKTVYKQECMNYTIAILPLGLYNLHLHLSRANVYYCL